MRYFFTLLLISGMANSLSAQDLGSHQWQDRVLLLLTDDLQNPEYIRQTDALQQHPGELAERKLVVYTLNEGRYSKGIPPGPWNKGVTRKHRIKDAKTGFRIVLIGLDGGVKLDKPAFTAPEVLWTLIDGMPMRRAELRNNGNR
jgi:hypothetical protein